jgi:hypothetical protein
MTAKESKAHRQGEGMYINKYDIEKKTRMNYLLREEWPWLTPFERAFRAGLPSTGRNRNSETMQTWL